jgi:lysophospholipase L1-like esterase
LAIASLVAFLVLAGPAWGALPSSLSALGDSLTRGYGAGGSAQDYPGGSWSSGSDPAVNSHYLRLLADGAALGGKNFNNAVSGSLMAATNAQAQTAVAQGAQYVTLWSGTNDVCTPTVGQMTSVATFTSQVRTTLTTLTNGLPGVQILVVSIPNWYGFWQAYQGNGTAKNAWATYSNRCPDLLSASATAADRATFAQRVTDLNSALSSVCATFANCLYDGGAVYNLWPTLTSADVAFDFFHLSLAGQAKVASTLWTPGFFAASPQTLVGYPAVGAQSSPDGPNYLDVSGPWSLSQAAPVSQLRGYVAGGAAVSKLRTVVYADNGGTPGAVVATSTEVSVPAQQAASWVVFPLPASVSVPAGRYWLGYWYADGNTTISFDTGVSSQRYKQATYASTGSAPASFGAASTDVHNYSIYLKLDTAVSPPVNSGLPVISGLAQQGQVLSASSGSWSGSPTSFAYQWRRCDSAGAGCVDIAGASGQSYVLVAGDVGSTVRVVVTASNAGGSGSATSAQTGVVVASSGGVPAGFTSVVTDAGCAGCSVVSIANGLRASVQGGVDTLDTAYGLNDFGGVSGLVGRVFVRDLLGLGQGQVLTANLAVFQVRDVSDGLVYELYVAPDRSLNLWSPAGGLRAGSILASTGVSVPNDGSTIQVEVSALANGSIVVRVAGVDRVTLTGLSGATTGNQRYLRAGIDHYDSASSNEPVSTVHTYVGLSQTTWLGAPGGTAPPVNSGLPVISGLAQQGQVLSASSGSWSGSPTSFAYQWRRCDSAGAGCVDIAGASGQSYVLVAGDVGSTVRVVVTASNAGGSGSATSAQTGVVVASSGGVPAGFTSVVTDAGCAGCSVVSIANGLRASVQGGVDTLDTAYGLNDFGGVSGLVGRVFVRDLLGLGQGQVLTANLAVFQVRDVSDGLVYELYVAPDRSLNLWSPAGGLRAGSILASTGVSVPNDGSTIQVEVSALANGSIVVRVAGVDRVTLTGLSGATTGNQRYLRAGIDHYDSASSNEPVSTVHTYVGLSQTTWLGAP